jgi:hypothetical protein
LEHEQKRSHYDSIRQTFLHELNDEGIIWVSYILMNDNSADLFTKNLSGPIFEKHMLHHISELMNSTWVRKGVNEFQREGVT